MCESSVVLAGLSLFKVINKKKSRLLQRPVPTRVTPAAAMYDIPKLPRIPELPENKSSSKKLLFGNLFSGRSGIREALGNVSI